MFGNSMSASTFSRNQGSITSPLVKLPPSLKVFLRSSAAANSLFSNAPLLSSDFKSLKPIKVKHN